MHVVNHPRTRRATQIAGPIGDTEVLLRVATTAISRDHWVVAPIIPASPAAAFESALGAGA